MKNKKFIKQKTFTKVRTMAAFRENSLSLHRLITFKSIDPKSNCQFTTPRNSQRVGNSTYQQPDFFLNK